MNLRAVAATSFSLVSGRGLGLVATVAVPGLMLFAGTSGWRSSDLSVWRIVLLPFERSPQESSSAMGTGIFLVAAGFGAITVLLSHTNSGGRVVD